MNEQEKNEAFGFHLMLDCYDCSPEFLNDINFCYEFLDKLVDEIGAIKQTQPYIFRTPEGHDGKDGLSGWVPIVESGISIHTLTDTNFISLDIYSCREFDNNKIINFVKKSFCPQNIEKNYILRGRKYKK